MRHYIKYLYIIADLVVACNKEKDKADEFIGAAGEGRINDVRRSLDEGELHVDFQDNNDETALICAAANGHQKICELLISRDCKVDI